jgi:hypothetical protein
MVRSPQTLSEADRRLVAAWAADCAERVLWLYEAEAPADDRPRAAIARTRAFARGELNTAEEIRRRFVGGVAAGDAKAPAAAAAARAAGQAVAICHMGAHALGAAAYAVKAASLAAPDRPEAAQDEIRWQLTHMTTQVRAALRALPPVGENRSGPLGPGLLASGLLGMIIRDLQAGLALPDLGDPTRQHDGALDSMIVVTTLDRRTGPRPSPCETADSTRARHSTEAIQLPCGARTKNCMHEPLAVMQVKQNDLGASL